MDRLWTECIVILLCLAIFMPPFSEKLSLSRIAWSCLFVLFVPTGKILTREDLALPDLSLSMSKLEKTISLEMKKKGIPGLQVTLFQPNAQITRAYGFLDSSRNDKISPDSLFQSGNLVQPLMAYLILREVQKHTATYRTSAKMSLPNQVKVTLADILSMTSGLPTYRDGIIPVGRHKTPMTRKDALQKSLVIKTLPQTEIQPAPQGYAYLREILIHLYKQDILRQAHLEMKQNGMNHSCIQIQECSHPKRLSEPLVTVKDSFFHAPPIEILFPSAHSLYTSSKQYSHLLRNLWKKGKSDSSSPAVLLFQEHFQYHPNIGGMSLGFSFSRPLWLGNQDQSRQKRPYKEATVFYIQSSFPGWSSLAFINKADGSGAVFLANTDNLFFLQLLQSHLLQIYQLMSPEIRVKELNHIQSNHNKMSGFYRPHAILPQKQNFLSFLNELQIRRRPDMFEISSVFEKEIGLRMYPIENKFFLVYGNADMGGWRIAPEKNSNGEITGFVGDLAHYNRVSLFFSTRMILVFLGCLAALPILIPLLYLIFRRSPILQKKS